MSLYWTEERVEKLKKLWSEGCSASQIAAQLGGVSRNAVIGKVHRLNLPGRAKGGHRAAKPRVAKPPANPTPPEVQALPIPLVERKPLPEAKPASIAEPVTEREEVTALSIVPISRRLELHQLTETTCHWPVGDPLAKDFHFCGDQADGTYCSYHARLAYQPKRKQREYTKTSSYHQAF